MGVDQSSLLLTTLTGHQNSRVYNKASICLRGMILRRRNQIFQRLLYTKCARIELFSALGLAFERKQVPRFVEKVSS
jgi:hypothetical protein